MTAPAPTPVRIQRKRTKGFDLQAASRAVNGLDCVYVGRPTMWGNPYDFRPSEFCWAALGMGERGDRRGRIAASVKAYRAWVNAASPGSIIIEDRYSLRIGDGLETDREVVSASVQIGRRAPLICEITAELRGKNLACWCALGGTPCHADVLLEIANRPI